MKFNPEQSARLQKWGLFIMMAGSLGFSLSMNPQHFNNIARNEIRPVHFTEMASNEGNGETARATTTAAKPPPGEEAKLQERTFPVLGNGSPCIVSIGVIQGQTIGLFKSMSQGQPCKLDNQTRRFTTTNLSDINALQTEVLAILASADSTGATVADNKPAQKAGAATEVDLDKWAEKCEKLTDSALTNCHKTRLIELSKYLKNDASTGDLVFQYFQKHLSSEIRNGLHQPTVREVSRDRCEGTVLSWSQFNRVLCQSTDNLEAAQELSLEITSGLRAGNGKKVVDLLMKSEAGSFSSQLRHSKSLAMRGYEEGDQQKFALGLRGMDFNTQMSLLNNRNSEFLDAIAQMQGSYQQKSLIERTLENSLYGPVGSMLHQMRQSHLTQNNGTTTNPLFAFDIPALGGETANTIGSLDPYLPGTGLPGNIPNGVRRNARGANIAFNVTAGLNFPGSTLPGSTFGRPGLTTSQTPLWLRPTPSSFQQQPALGGRSARN